MRVSSSRKAFVLLGLLAAVSLLAAALTASAPRADGSETPRNERAEALAAAPAVDRSGGRRYSDAAAMRDAAQGFARRVPFPPNGNANGVRWEEIGDGLDEATVETIVEYNAFCQWLRATRDPDGRTAALAVLDEVPRWPTFRDQPDLGIIRRVIAEAGAGGGPALEETLAECDASHAREVAYAEVLGLPASS